MLSQRGLDRLLKLTSQQKSILAALLKGRTLKEIADALKVTAKTVSYHKHQIQKIFEVKTDVEMVRYAITHGIDHILQKLELKTVPTPAYQCTAYFKDGETITQPVPDEDWEF